MENDLFDYIEPDAEREALVTAAFANAKHEAAEFIGLLNRLAGHTGQKAKQVTATNVAVDEKAAL